MKQGCELENWRKAHPHALPLSIMVASSAVECMDLLNIVTHGLKSPMFPSVPTPGQWLRLYRNHREVVGGIAATFGGSDSESTKLGSFAANSFASLGVLAGLDDQGRAKVAADAVAELQKLSPAELQEQMNAIKEMAAAFEEESLSDEISPEEAEFFKTLFPKPEAQFFFRVAFPCWLLHGQTVTRLLRRARCGNFDALDALLRLDKAVVADRGVARQLMHAQWNNRTRFRKLLSALSGKPTNRITMTKLKTVLAGYISKMSKHLPVPLTAPDIRALYDAIAKDKGKLRDFDIQDGDEAWARAVHRERIFWEMVPAVKSVVGQKSCAQVSGGLPA